LWRFGEPFANVSHRLKINPFHEPGNHGDGEKANTETPLIAWGAGINKPQFEEAVQGHGISPPSWRVNHLKRFDVEQADIAPLMVRILIKYLIQSLYFN
jgi:hypothetical protein